MKTILLPVSADGPSGPAAEFALAFARHQGGHLQGIHVRPLPPIVAGEGITVPGDYVARMTEEGRQAGDSAREAFEAYVKAGSIKSVEAIGADDAIATAAWSEFDGVESQVIGEYGRGFDVIVLDRRDGSPGHDWKAACEAGLFESGKPVILAAGVASNMPPRRILISWNGSTETARAIALARPLLELADAVHIISVEGGLVPGPSVDDMAVMLKRNGINATARHFDQSVPSVGEKTLAEANDWNADLLVKGAFTQSRLRQMIFGGATSHILDHATVPVLFAH